MARAYIKPAKAVKARIAELETSILDHSDQTIHQKRAHMAWRDSLKWHLDGKPKSATAIDKEIKRLTKEVLDNRRLTIHTKGDYINRRAALVWLRTEEKAAWDEAIKELEASPDWQKLKETQAAAKPPLRAIAQKWNQKPGFLEHQLGRRYRPSEFALLAFGWQAFDYQIGPLDSESTSLVLNFGRQSGKTMLTAVKALHFALWNDNATVLIISRTDRQASIMFNRMKSLLIQSSRRKPELGLHLFIQRKTQRILELVNGASVYCLPSTEDGSNILGFTAHMVIIDEASRVNEPVFGAVLPMLATTRGPFMLTSTPKGSHNFFASALSNPEYGFEVYHYDSTQGVNYINPETGESMITEEKLQKEMIRLGDLLFRQEYKAELIEEADAFFPRELVDRCIDAGCPQRDAPLRECVYYIGVDPAREGKDETALCILEMRGDGTAFAVKLASYRKQDIAVSANLVYALHETWKFRAIMIDETGVGAGLLDVLKAAGLPAYGLRFTQKSKEESFSHCKSLMMREKLVLPPHKVLRQQLLDMRFEPMQAFIKIFVTSERLFHDDFVAALVLACWGIKEKKLVALWGRPVRGIFAGN